MFGVDSQRGQSEVLGAVLVFALVMLGIGLVLMGGGQAINSSNQAVVEDQTREGLVDLAGEVDAITHGSGDTKQTNLNLNLEGQQNGVQVRESAGSLRLEVGGSTVYDGPLGAVVYSTGDTTIAYQGGGVWRADGDGASIVSEPGASERGGSPGTLTLPIVQVTGSTTLGGQTVLTREATNQLYPSIDVGATETVTIRIESQFAEAWAEYFVDSLGVDESAVTVSGDTVEVEYASSGRAYLHVTHYRVSISES
jgi:hypothetical protein